MRTSKTPAAPDGATGATTATASGRRQPVRQTRVNPQRTSSLNRNNPLATGPAPEQPINILPGVTHFADAITALPKELVRHFTLLKEVDAKIFAPEAALFDLLRAALNSCPPDRTVPLFPGVPAAQPDAAAAPSNPFDPSNLPRRTLFRDTALKIQELLVSLEEKNHVISTANDALHKQLSRIDEIWPHLEAEFSDEAKWGSETHWAYVDNRQAKANDKQAERSRREGAAALSAAAQALAEEAAARSNDRKQALAAKKNNKNQPADADADKNQEGGKKGQGAKSRKPLPDSGPVGLGIAGAQTGATVTNKRRKPDAKTNGGAPMERAMSSVYGANASKKGTTSPRETPAPEGGKKRKALPTSSGQAKKSRTAAGASPSVTSSPVIGSFPDPGKTGRDSPIPSGTSKPATSRARQNSVSQANTERRPSTALPNKANGDLPETPEEGQTSNGAKNGAESTAQKETNVPIITKPGAQKPDTDEAPPTPDLGASNGTKKDAAASKASEETPANKKDAGLAIQPTPTGVVKTKSGRASKPSTPAIGSFPDSSAASGAGSNGGAGGAAMSRSRSARNHAESAAASTANAGNSNNAAATSAAGGGGKRSHKKGASVSSAAAAVGATPAGTSGAAADKEKDKDAATNGNGNGRKSQDRASASTASTATGDSNNGRAAQTSTKDRRRDDDGSSSGTKAADAENGGHHGKNGRNNKQQQQQQRQEDEDEEMADEEEAAQDEEEEEDDDQGQEDDVYCYCNQGSYGEMVACDGEGCPREWFHLECVGLRVAPRGNAKWYCEDCKKRLKIGERR
ncbi:hypothetical protein VTJ04DRAFT_8558 [Mycothermus thermophilus]|uniref:uncharacterized protein n=1 Tax=Humicola insolens TaxID=85995 RepID=UPI0037427B7C